MSEPVPVYLLAGGRSSRFGEDKARALLDGEPLLLRLARLLAPVASALTVVAEREGKHADLGLRTLADRRPGLGPLAGLETALLDRGDGWLLLTSCDWVTLEPAWVSRLLAARSPGAHAVAFRGEVWQPLLALYHTGLAPQVTVRLEAGQLPLWRLLEGCGATAVPLPEDWDRALQANTPAELAALRTG